MAVKAILITIPIALIAALAAAFQYNLGALGILAVYSALGQAMFMSVIGALVVLGVPITKQ